LGSGGRTQRAATASRRHSFAHYVGMNKPTRIKDKLITCDATNNPPTTVDQVLNVDVRIQFVDQFLEHFVLRLPIPLAALRDGKLRTVDVQSISSVGFA